MRGEAWKGYFPTAVWIDSRTAKKFQKNGGLLEPDRAGEAGTVSREFRPSPSRVMISIDRNIRLPPQHRCTAETLRPTMGAMKLLLASDACGLLKELLPEKWGSVSVQLPIYTSIHISGYQMYPGTSDRPGIQHDFTPGLHLVAGVNGLANLRFCSCSITGLLGQQRSGMMTSVFHHQK